MKRKILLPLAFFLLAGLVFNTGCQKGDLVDNPNIAGSSTLIPTSLILNHITSNLMFGDEQPWGDGYKFGQYWLSNYSYYRGGNTYNWSTTEDTYTGTFKYASALQVQAKAQNSTINNPYSALALFFEAYGGIFNAERIGDCPFSQASNASIITPKFDVQHDIYKSALAKLDSANTLMGAYIAAGGSGTIAGDVLFNGTGSGALTAAQWQKVINAYTLRVLVSLSKRAVDNADLNVISQFNKIVTNPTQYPLLGSNSDNLTYVFNTINPYPIKARGNQPYNKYANMCKPFMSVLSTTQDPRIFLFATPAPALIAGGKTLGDFTAYVGADYNLTQPVILNSSDPVTGIYSFANGARYYATTDGKTADPFIIVGFVEQQLNIAEGLNRGWAPSLTTATYYNSALAAGFSLFGLTDGKSVPVSDLAGNTLGNVTISISNFNTLNAYAGDNANGLTQILNEKYIAYFNNAGYEGFYQWRRTGVPAFSQGGAGIGTPSNNIPRRWQISSAEQTYNSANYTASVTSQFGGTDDVTKDTWLTK